MTPRLAALLVALVALTPALPSALASEHEDDAAESDETDEGAPPESEVEAAQNEAKEKEKTDDEDEEWEADERDLALRTTEGGFEYESRRESPLDSDEIKATFDASNARFRFEYDAEGEDVGAQLAFRVDFGSLFEHEDPDGDGTYDVGEPVLRRIPLSGLAPVMTAQRSGSIETVDVTYSLPGGGTLVLRFYATPVPAQIAGVALSPTEAKYDVILRDVAWTANASRIALETRTRTTLEAEYDEADDGVPGIEFRRDGVTGFHRWLNTTQVDGRAEPVGATVLAQKTTREENGFAAESVVIFSYAQGASITHDPSFGVERLEEVVGTLVATTGDVRIFGLSLAATAGIVALTAIPRLRRRG